VKADLDHWSVRLRSTSYSSRAATKVQGASDNFPSVAVQGGTTLVTAQCDAFGS